MQHCVSHKLQLPAKFNPNRYQILIMTPLSIYISFYTSLIGGMLNLLFARLNTPQKPQQRDLSGQTALVTGANSGLGLSIATSLAQQGATIYLACRNLDKGARAIDHIVSRVGENTRGKLQCWELDTSDLASVRRFATRWENEARGKKVDMLVHNAGIASPPPHAPKTTPSGMDMVYVTNFLGSFLLTHLLEHHLSDDARVVLTSSTGHYAAAGSLFASPSPSPVRTSVSAAHSVKQTLRRTINRVAKLLGVKMESSSSAAYALSKAQQVLFAHILQSRFSSQTSSKRTAHAFTPGFTSTPIFGKFDVTWRTWLSSPAFAVLKATEKWVAVDTDEGSKTGAWLAAGGVKEGGGYWEWMRRLTSLVDFVRGKVGERRWMQMCGERWEAWGRDCGVDWNIEM
jgi:NAD(P)-dependent dehydrogenase (short-subunit alcohol dehydrogenase family)